MEDESKDMREVGNAVTGGGNEGSGGGGEEEGERVRTLFVSGIPMDVTTREMYLLFRACEGYEDNTIKPSPKGVSTCSTFFFHLLFSFAAFGACSGRVECFFRGGVATAMVFFHHCFLLAVMVLAMLLVVIVATLFSIFPF